MILSCPNQDIEDNTQRCSGEVKLESEQMSNGDGVWAESYWTFFVASGDDKPRCSEGCELTDDQVRKLEQDAYEDYAASED